MIKIIVKIIENLIAPARLKKGIITTESTEKVSNSLNPLLPNLSSSFVSFANKYPTGIDNININTSSINCNI
jgi:hypothetical protein